MGRETSRAHLLMPTVAGLGHAKARGHELHPWLPCGAKRPSCLSHLVAFLQGKGCSLKFLFSLICTRSIQQPFPLPFHKCIPIQNSFKIHTPKSKVQEENVCRWGLWEVHQTQQQSPWEGTRVYTRGPCMSLTVPMSVYDPRRGAFMDPKGSRHSSDTGCANSLSWTLQTPEM